MCRQEMLGVGSETDVPGFIAPPAHHPQAAHARCIPQTGASTRRYRKHVAAIGTELDRANVEAMNCVAHTEPLTCLQIPGMQGAAAVAADKHPATWAGGNLRRPPDIA